MIKLRTWSVVTFGTICMVLALCVVSVFIRHVFVDKTKLPLNANSRLEFSSYPGTVFFQGDKYLGEQTVQLGIDQLVSREATPVNRPTLTNLSEEKLRWSDARWREELISDVLPQAGPILFSADLGGLSSKGYKVRAIEVVMGRGKLCDPLLVVFLFCNGETGERTVRAVSMRARMREYPDTVLRPQSGHISRDVSAGAVLAMDRGLVAFNWAFEEEDLPDDLAQTRRRAGIWWPESPPEL